MTGLEKERVMSQSVVVAKSVDVEGWSVCVTDADDTPLVLDLDLAKHLGYKRPYDIRELVRRLSADEKSNAFGVIRTVRKTSERVGGRPTVEYLLTEAQALLVTAKSDTPKACAMLAHIVDVFIAARKGLLPQQQPPPAPAMTVDALAPALIPLIARVVREINAQDMRPRETDPAIPKSYVAQIKENLRVAACYRVSSGQSPSMRSARTTVENVMRENVKWWGRGTSIKNMPADLGLKALRCTEVIRRDEQRRAKAIDEHQSVQLDLALLDMSNRPN